MTGFPRSSGRSRCSTAAKNASRSTWRIVRAPTHAILRRRDRHELVANNPDHRRGEAAPPAAVPSARIQRGGGGMSETTAGTASSGSGSLARARGYWDTTYGAHIVERASTRPELWGFLVL